MSFDKLFIGSSESFSWIDASPVICFMYDCFNYWFLAMFLFTVRVTCLLDMSKLKMKLTQRFFLPSHLTLPLEVIEWGSYSGVIVLSNFFSLSSLDFDLAAYIFIFTLSFAE